MNKISLFDTISYIDRFIIREAEIKGFVPRGFLENVLIYEEFLYWRAPERKQKKCEIYKRLSDRYGYGITTIRKKIYTMASPDFPSEIVSDLDSYRNYMCLRYKQMAELGLIPGV